jgi:hypothetical protein
VNIDSVLFSVPIVSITSKENRRHKEVRKRVVVNRNTGTSCPVTSLRVSSQQMALTS